MQIKILGEQPFQVLSTTFTIGPSADGYDLMFSADGVNYSKLFTVGANTNRQVTQVAAGSYYYLSGNTGNVVVNWFGNCVDGSGGGGSYVLPVASQDTLGGVKIGSGLTMSGDTLNANPGGYTLPIASENVLGGVKIGSGITIDSGGTISAQGGGAPSDYNAVKEQVSANTENIETLSAVTSGLTEAVAGKQDTLSAGNGIDLSGSTISVKIGDGLAYSGNTIVVSGGTGGGGIEKVSSLPATAEEGDVVWLEGASRTGYTILFGENVGYAGWPWELYMEVFTLDGVSPGARYGGWLGRWRNFSQFNGDRGEYSDIMVRPRLASNNAVVDIIIINGNHTIGLGQNGISMTSDVEFHDRGCLYVYTGGKWYSKPTFEWKYNQSEAVALLDKIRGGIEDFDVDNFVMRYEVNGVSREFKIILTAHFGVDFQASDDRGNVDNWGRLSVLNYRIENNGGISDQVGEHWIVSSDQLPDYSTRIIRIDSAGTVTDADGFELLPNMYGISTRIEFIAEFDNKCNAAPLKWWYRQYEEVSDETILFYYVCTEIPINGVVYKGIWKAAEYEWDSGLTPTTWTAV